MVLLLLFITVCLVRNVNERCRSGRVHVIGMGGVVRQPIAGVFTSVLCGDARVGRMSSFLDSVEKEYSTRNLYHVLGLEKSAKEVDIKRCYRKMSLKVHPDRVEPDQIEEATRKFQVRKTVWSYFLGSTDVSSDEIHRFFARFI